VRDERALGAFQSGVLIVPERCVLGAGPGRASMSTCRPADASRCPNPPHVTF
jgi:hypothetical protein